MNFDSKRFTTLIKHGILENKATYIRLYIGAFAAFSMIILLTLLTMDFGYQTDYYGKKKFSLDTLQSACVGANTICMVALAIMASVAASHIFSNMNTKQSRISFLMLPATNLEKYLSRYILHTVLATTGLFLTYMVADLSCSIITLLVTPSFTSPLLTAFEPYMEEIIDAIKENPGVIFLALTMPSTLILGGTLFRRVPFILTNIATYAITNCAGIAGLILFAIVGPIFPDSFGGGEDDFVLNAIFFYLVPIAWIVFCHWASYRIFCRSSVIGHKTFGM